MPLFAAGNVSVSGGALLISVEASFLNTRQAVAGFWFGVAKRSRASGFVKAMEDTWARRSEVEVAKRF